MIELDVTPMGAVRMTRADAWKKRKCVLKYWEYKDLLKSEAKKHNYKLTEILKDITFVIPFPKSYNQKKKQSLEGKPHTLKPDTDNIIKGFKDALIKDSLLKDDCEVHTYNNIRKIWGETGKIIIGQDIIINV